MQPTELSQRTSLNGSAPPEKSPADRAPDDTTQSLGSEIVTLARTLPGDLRRLTVRSGDREIQVEWTGEPAGPRPSAGPAAPEAPATPAGEEHEPAEGTVAVRAPLVGTFYAAPSPGSDPFVRVGDTVEAGQTLGIVEAMKLMNPIPAEEAGVVTEVLVGDAESVEYDQALMRVRPSGRSR